jgi:uncharacterized repeat protein (TIGR01451 family)
MERQLSRAGRLYARPHLPDDHPQRRRHLHQQRRRDGRLRADRHDHQRLRQRAGHVERRPPAAVSRPRQVGQPHGNVLPGSDLTYTIAFTNSGGAPASSLAVFDPIPANTDFKLNSAAASLGTTGLTASIEYSNDNGTTYTYTPVDGGGGAPAGYDRNVTHVRWSFTGGLSQTAPNSSGSVSFSVRIR